MLMRLLRAHHRLITRLRISPFVLLVCASLGLFALHTTEIWRVDSSAPHLLQVECSAGDHVFPRMCAT